MGRIKIAARWSALVMMGASLPLAPAAGWAADLPAGGAEVEIVLETHGGLLDLGLFDGLLPGPADDLIEDTEAAIPPVAGDEIDEILGGTGVIGGTDSSPAAASTTTTAPKAPAAAGPGTTTTTQPRGVVEDKGTGDSGYDENRGRATQDAESRADASKGSAATPAPKPAPAPADKNRSRFALSGADVMFLAATGIGLVALGLSFRSLRWQRRGRAGRSS